MTVIDKAAPGPGGDGAALSFHKGMENVPPDGVVRRRVSLRGAVQGVGFRPFVYRLASELKLAGWVQNSPQGVLLEVEGGEAGVMEFQRRLAADKPPRAVICSLEKVCLDPKGYKGFEIRTSSQGGIRTALVLPDIAVCAECLKEIRDPGNRRHRYPFTNCTNCGPRFTIIASLPYDRARTSMSVFPMCPLCRSEYENPKDRRFHAEPNACPVCGPHMELWDAAGGLLASGEDALKEGEQAIRDGKVVAVKGVGGFHLMVAAQNQDAVRLIRRRKHREMKPLALMFPTLASVREICRVTEMEEQLLMSPESPIVLLSRDVDGKIAPAVAPGNPYLGVMLPYTPLHHLLLGDLGFPVVATSANLSDEPICVDGREALVRLKGIADVFLTHNRQIFHHADDSVVRIMAGREMVIRRARGYAPLPVYVRRPLQAALALGGHLKNTVAVVSQNQVFVSQHIGNLETKEAYDAFCHAAKNMQNLYGVDPKHVACDMHPDYLSTRHADQLGLPVTSVQHHHAHIVSCMAENDLEGKVLGVAWDGTGFGPDETVWGGEFLLGDENSFLRVGHFRTFFLPGGENAVNEPRRSALGLLYKVYGEEILQMTHLPTIQAFKIGERQILKVMLHNGLQMPGTSSVGRLFDAVASLTGLRQTCRHEGQAAMELEFSMMGWETDEAYSFSIQEKGEGMGTRLIDWAPMVREMVEDVRNRMATGEVAAKFHNALVETIVAMARVAGEPRVVMSGGCFQNRYLTERAVRRLREEGFRPYWHQRIPPNDGGIALGQLVAAGLATADTGNPVELPVDGTAF
ncbi:MAG: carbamoyltransferase HypF [Verrucomicrobiae bacterium]|nr:carbamoyltransferase HypF [Verrucomicrobiae bacterium]